MKNPEAGGRDHDRKWVEFSLAIMLVLGISIFTVLAVTGLVSIVQMGGLVRQEQERRANILASFVARRAFVAFNLKDTRALERILDTYVEAQDLASVEIHDANGREFLVRRRQDLASRPTVQASRPVVAPVEDDGAPESEAIGRVTVTLSLERVYGAVARAFRWIVIAGLAVLAAAVALDLMLIRRMTLRLRVLVGEAKLAEELKRSNRELEQFAFVASHDLQEPLRKIVSYCQLLEQEYKGKLDAQGADFLGIIVKGSKRMSVLIHDLLSFSRIGTQGKPLEPVDAGVVLGEVLGVLEGRIAADGAVVKADALPTVLGDAGQLSQLFENLIVNALKFHGDAPARIRVTAQREGEWWRFSFEDNGIGIEAKHRERIFEMFKRLHSRDEFPGTGIGLAICRKIVERHGGRITAEGNPAGGTIFSFNLPSAAAAGPQTVS